MILEVFSKVNDSVILCWTELGLNISVRIRNKEIWGVRNTNGVSGAQAPLWVCADELLQVSNSCVTHGNLPMASLR